MTFIVQLKMILDKNIEKSITFINYKQLNVNETESFSLEEKLCYLLINICCVIFCINRRLYENYFGKNIC